jgi:putative ABC transport system substrate-binding protein
VTSTIPIVFLTGDDPVGTGLVTSLNRPGGNVTGFGLFIADLTAKRFELLTMMVPDAATIAVLVNPNNHQSAQTNARDAQSAAEALGRQILVLNATSPAEIDAAFAALLQRGAAALLVGTDIYFATQRAQLVALASRYRIPTIHIWRDFVVDGGLASYGSVHAEPYRQAAGYAARILRGEKPNDLPVAQPTKFEFVINLRTAAALSLPIPPTVLAIADEVIE